MLNVFVPGLIECACIVITPSLYPNQHLSHDTDMHKTTGDQQLPAGMWSLMHAASGTQLLASCKTVPGRLAVR